MNHDPKRDGKPGRGGDPPSEEGRKPAGDSIFHYATDDLIRKDVETEPAESLSSIPCYEPWWILCIDEQGRARPCTRAEVFESVKGRPLKEVWESPSFQAFRRMLERKELSHFCATCCPASVEVNREVRAILQGMPDREGLRIDREALRETERADRALVLFHEGTAFSREGRYAEAEDAFRRALALGIVDPRIVPEAECGLGEAALARRKGAEALAVFERLIEGLLADDGPARLTDSGTHSKTPSKPAPDLSARAWAGRIEALSLSGRHGDALDAGGTALEHAGDRPEAQARVHTALAGSCRELGRLEDAGEAYRRALALEPLTERTRLGAERGLADTALARGDAEAALSKYEAILAGYGGEAEAVTGAWVGKVEALRRAGRNAEALEAGEAALARVGHRPRERARIFCVQARAHEAEGRLDAAEGAYRKILALDDADSGIVRDAEHGLADVSLARGDLDGALAAYEALIRKYGDDPGALINAAMRRIELLEESGRPEAALEACAQTLDRLRHRPLEQARILCARGRILWRRGRLDEAEADFRRASALAVEDPRILREAERGLAQVALARGETDTALAIFERLIVEHRHDGDTFANAWVGKIEALEEAGRYGEALDASEAALSVLSGRPRETARTHCAQARVHEKCGRLGAAEAAYRRALASKVPGVVEEAERALTAMMETE